MASCPTLRFEVMLARLLVDEMLKKADGIGCLVHERKERAARALEAWSLKQQKKPMNAT